MIKWVSTRLIIEKPGTHKKYFPTVLTATTQQSYPFSISYANIEIASNVMNSTAGFISQLEYDDIVRLQVSVKYNPNQWTVWEDLFHGRIVDISAEFSQNNDVQLYCWGHEAEATSALIEGTHSFTSQDAKTVLSTLAPLYLSRLKYSAAMADTGIILPTYDTKPNQIYMSDLFSEMETVSGQDWFIKAVPTYTSTGNLGDINLQWKPFPTAPTTNYKAWEGSFRLLKADFSSSGQKVKTAYRVNGDTVDSTQYTGYAQDAALVAKYGKKTGVDTKTWIKSNSLCTSIASGVLAGVKMPALAGQVELEGTPRAQICDLVSCRVPSIDLNGSYVNANFPVYRVQHTIRDNAYTTLLDVGEIKRDIYDFIGMVDKSAKTATKNQVK